MAEAVGTEPSSGPARPWASKPPRHPTPLPPPTDDFRPVEGVPDLYYHWESAWGGVMLLGTETIAVVLFNGGFPMEDVTLDVCGQDTLGRETCTLMREMDTLPRGREVRFEVASYELDGTASQITVSVRSGRYVPES